MSQEPHRQRLLEQLERRQLALFIGADLPREATGLPSRADLARALAQRHGLVGQDAILPYSLAEVAQRVSQAGNRYEFTSFLRDQLDTTGRSPQPFHRRIVELVQAHQVETLITTAYDDLLKRAFQEASVGLNHVVRGGDVAFARRGQPTLIRLYGDAQQVDTLVVTADDHYGLWRDRDKENLLAEVRHALGQNVILFLGYDLSDPDFNLLWREVLDRAGRFVLGAYAVWPGLPEADVRMWRDRGITILEADPLGILGNAVVLPAPSSRPDVTVTVPEKPPRLTWDIAALRKLLNDTFDDPELDAFCLEQFPKVYDKFGRGMRKDEKITLLLDHCRRNPEERARLTSALAWHVAPHTARTTAGPPPGALVRGRTTSLVPQEPTEIRRRYALLVGVRDYTDPNYRALPHTVHDVTALEQVLSEADYTVRALHSDQAEPTGRPTRENVWGELENIAGQTGPGDLLLVHFGGHGDLSGDAAYLLPENARKASLHRTAIDLDEFKRVLRDAGAQAKVLILDACHSGIGRDVAGMDEAFARHVHLEAAGVATLAACRRGEVAHEHDASSHGAFTYYLLEGLRGAAIREGGRFVTFNSLNDYVTHAVKDWAIRSSLHQWPNASTELVGDPPLVVVRTLGDSP